MENPMDIMFRQGLLIGILLTIVQPALAQGAFQLTPNQSIGQPAVVPVTQIPEQPASELSLSDMKWFSIFNVSNKVLPGSYYAYSIVPATGSPQSCISPCQQLTLPEQRDGVSPIPASCFVPYCSLYLNIFLQGKTAGPSCQNIDLNNISEVWIYFNHDRFSATCQAFYPKPPAIPGGALQPVGTMLPVGGTLPPASGAPVPTSIPAAP
jgi:hypothetical protein